MCWSFRLSFNWYPRLCAEVSGGPFNWYPRLCAEVSGCLFKWYPRLYAEVSGCPFNWYPRLCAEVSGCLFNWYPRLCWSFRLSLQLISKATVHTQRWLSNQVFTFTVFIIKPTGQWQYINHLELDNMYMQWTVWCSKHWISVYAAVHLRSHLYSPHINYGQLQVTLCTIQRPMV